MARAVVALAGASGDLGFRIARDLVELGADVRALVRREVGHAKRDRLEAVGVSLVEADPLDREEVAAACSGAGCTVSALNGLHEVIVVRQQILLDASVAAGVKRFVSSDFSEDFTKTTPGRNRNLDLRREFMAIADRAPIAVTSILNGAFMDLLGAEMPIIQRPIWRVLYWRSADQPLDFTTKDDVAAYAAAATLDNCTPRILRIAGDTVTARQIAALMSDVEQRRYRTLRCGSIGALSAMIAIAKRVAPQPGEPFPVWQGMQYMRDMFSGEGQLMSLDNNRYPDLRWTTVQRHLEVLDIR